MIIIRNLSKKYRTKNRESLVFENVNLTIRFGQSIALIGKNGAGKSTFLKLLAGIDYPDSGEIVTNKLISWPIGSKEAFHPLLTPRQNIKFICMVLIGNIKKKINEKMDFIEDFADIGTGFDRPFNTLSAGMKNRVSFGLSMAFEFDFYLIDELSSAGDQLFREKSRDYLKKKLKDSCFIMVDHNLKNLENNCNKALLITNNTIQEYNDVKEAIEIHRKNLLENY